MGITNRHTDITDRKKTTKQLQQSEQFYRALVADSLDAIILMNEDGRITFISPSVKHVLGYEAEEAQGKNGFEFVHPDDLDLAAASFQKEVIENPEIKFIVVRLLKKNGEWLWCMVRGHNLLKNPYVKSIVVYFHDDTLRKQATDALRESEKRFRTLIKDLHIGVLLQDAEGNILLSNNAMYRMFHVQEAALLGKQIWILYSDVVREDGSIFEFNERPGFKAIQTKQPVHDVVMGVWNPQRKERVWLLLSAEPILDENGEVQHVISSFTDITERKKLEQKLFENKINHQKQLTQATIDGQEAERREIGKELHDNFGQQLTTIKLFLDLAKSNANEYNGEMIDMALKKVTDVINEIRSMSRSLMPHTLKDLGLVDAVTDLIDSIGRVQVIEIAFDCKNFDEGTLAENQKLTLFRIIQEQLNNIVKHARAKNIFISLKGTTRIVLLEIKDDGQGFDQKTILRGLGFSNIRNRAELFGGKMNIITKPGDGCFLNVSMPIPFSPSTPYTGS